MILRTPFHVHYNLVLFTIAFIVPAGESDIKLPYPDLSVPNAWFIGAFGGWWRGWFLFPWWVDAAVRSKDEERVSSGVLNMKTLDSLNQYDGVCMNQYPDERWSSLSSGVSVLPFSSFEAKKSRGSPPRLRNPRNEASDDMHKVQKPLPPRSTTPPPLPATASLPLHNVQQSVCVPVPQSFHPSALGSVATTTSPPKGTDQSPVIADLLNRISSTKAGVQELRSQIADFRAQSSQQRETLNRDLEAHRERKRQEELTRSDLKSRTKSLEDSKRNAENVKREAERKLKSAQARRDEVARRITHLASEIIKWRSRLGDDREWIANIQSGGTAGDHEKMERVNLGGELQKRKAEIQVVEDVISTLTSRVKDLEDKVVDGRGRLKVIFEQAHQVSRLPEQDRNIVSPANPPTSLTDREDDLSWPPTKTPSTSSIHILGQPRVLVADDLICSHPPAKFSPFDDPASLVPTDGEMLQSAFLIPSELINSLVDAPLDMDLRSFKADNDPFIVQLNRPTTAWGNNDRTETHEATTTTIPRLANDPPSERILGNGNSGGRTVDTFDVSAHPQLKGSSLDQQRATLRTAVSDRHPVLDSFSSSPNLVDSPRDPGVTSPPRRWFSVKEKKKLNPEAEAFNLPNTRSSFKPTVPAFFDALNPSKSTLDSSLESNSPPHNPTESVTHSTFFSKAFAPSPAERAALGAGRFHTSLERLPSLSDVPGTLHTAPIISHTTSTSSQDAVTVAPGSSFARSMSWLNSLPRRKPKFSPWDDEDH